MKKYILTLTEDERKSLDLLTSKGKHRSQKILNALILLGCDEGEFQNKPSTNKEIATVLSISMKKLTAGRSDLLRMVLISPSMVEKEVAYTRKRQTGILKHIWLH